MLPKQCLHYGVLAELRVGKRLWPARVSEFTKNVAETNGFTTFAKINNLWLQWEGSSHHAAAATELFVFANPYETEEIFTFVCDGWLCTLIFKEKNPRDDLMHFLQNIPQKTAPAGRLNDPFYKIFPQKGPCGTTP